MTLCEEIYFEIKLTGAKSEVKKFASFLKSGELDEFFEITSDYIHYEDGYTEATDDGEVTMIFANDDYGIELDELDTEEFLEVFCRAARRLEVFGTMYDCDDEEYSFVSHTGDTYYLNSRKVGIFNDELDAHAREEESGEDDEKGDEE